MTGPEPAARAAGLILRDAHASRTMLPGQSAGLLGVTSSTVFAVESGHHRVGIAEVAGLTRLYRCDQVLQPLRGLLLLGAARAEVVRDGGAGRARRLAASLRARHTRRWSCPPPCPCLPIHAAHRPEWTVS